MSKALFLLVFLISQSLWALTPFEKSLQKWDQSTGAWPKKLERLYQLYWDNVMIQYPEWATYNGYPGQNHRLTDLSFEAIRTRENEIKSLQKVLDKIPVKTLKDEDLLSFKIFKRDIDLYVEKQRFPSHLMPIDQMEGIQNDFPDLLVDAPKLKHADYVDRLTRLKSVANKIDQTILLMKEGLKRKVTPPKVVLSGVPNQFDAVTNLDLSKNPLYKAFQDIGGELTQEQKEKVQTEAKEILNKEVIPAFKKLQTFVAQEYIPNCRTQTAWTSLPDGAAWYQYAVKKHTTTDMNFEAIHQLGLNEVKRIRAEMDAIKNKVGFKGSLTEFDRHLRESDKFHFKSAKELMTSYRDFAKQVDPELPRLFGKLPRLPYGIREMPAHKAPAAPTAYYMNGSIEAGRPGYFEANTYDLKARPTWQMEALTLHEAVPGHHLQITIAQELQGLPEFRKNFGTTAYVEGWGLYAESLGEDMGFYKDPYSKYGQLAYEMWRAIRLVVDTGVHAKNWSRDQVMQFFRDNGPYSEQQIMNETDRYIAMPGQALAYKIGELKFKELKKKARESLKDKFDIREFHDQVLGSGALPLNLLEEKINIWIEKKRKSS